MIGCPVATLSQPSGGESPQQQEATTFRSCPLCGCNNQLAAPLATSLPPWELKECPACQMVYLENALPYQALEESFAWQHQLDQHRIDQQQATPQSYHLRRTWRRWRKQIFRRKQVADWAEQFFPSGKVLDLGCGRGKNLHKLPGSHIPFGIEIGKDAAQQANQDAAQRGGKVWQGDCLSILKRLPEGSFQGVLLQSYLEHEIHPLPVLLEIARVLSYGGGVVIKVPNYDCWSRKIRGQKWCGFRFPDHVNYFTPTTLSEMVQRAGLSQVRFGWVDHLPTSDTMWLAARKMAVSISDQESVNSALESINFSTC
ncbi:Ubiquinone biosynthesis O-methyltransferase [Planctomycetales bacterium 10988]|nr:Ubiquinone biosynthesis O-methyltransferase [Planctomycetales bacterium 10988]